MSKIIIKKKVSLDFLGDEYSRAYITFRAIPLPDYEGITKELPQPNSRYVELVRQAEVGELSAEENDELTKLRISESEKNISSFGVILEFLKKYYVGGKFPNEAGELEDIDGVNELDALDSNAATRCFEVLTGQYDPKAEEISTTPSSTAP